MTWDALTGIGSILSAVIIAITAVLGLRQLRASHESLEQERRASQLEAVMALFADLRERRHVESRRFVVQELATRMKDAQFRREVAGQLLPDESTHPELLTLRYFEVIGAYIRHGLMDGAIVYDVAWPAIRSSWEGLGEVVATHRATPGGPRWENFEFLYRNAMAFHASRRSETEG